MESKLLLFINDTMIIFKICFNIYLTNENLKSNDKYRKFLKFIIGISELFLANLKF